MGQGVRQQIDLLTIELHHRAADLVPRRPLPLLAGRRAVGECQEMGENRGELEGEAVVGETPSPHPNPILHHRVPQSPCSTGRRVMEGAPGEGEDRGEREEQVVVGEEKPGREGKAAAAQERGKEEKGWVNSGG
ncbi:Os04g0312966 [Oryza sativa Japonica Group]|uniref:OSJNBa0087H01.1 protein n=4 Tax=Oryza sativa TaxID=4530 RepID=Q7F9W8_ORYSJ|nr:hypothetical protein OsI_15345 [Oryza sativa Indica Group]BAS88536.1 Os04g0312966 [Oryza sativa Japonica Group]CAE02160.1 OSJNBa0087H01.1 [Oryza sativa Japonica Group]CAE02244.2 OSJNBb0054B09.17 [Oryza sativa Japonica Group]CAH66297.1 OSIGBa0139J17.6 [Oryza sativa]